MNSRNNQGDAMISVVIPVRDEAGSIPLLASELAEAFADRPWSWECVWVDDGSRDGTRELLLRLGREDGRHRLIAFPENRGQSAALFAGWKASRGGIVATLDGDGQNDPADIPVLVDRLLSGGVEMVNGYRLRRRDSLARRLSSVVANRFRSRVVGRTVRDVGCSTRAFRRECVEDLPLFKGMHRFLPDLVAMRGYRIAEVPVNHRSRFRGATKYTIGNRLFVGLFDTFGVYWLKKRAFVYRRGDGGSP